MTAGITIRCINKSTAFDINTHKDDIIKIRYMGDASKLFRVSYINGIESYGSQGVMDERGVWHFVRTLIRSLCLDTGDPQCYSIQLDMPLFPSVMFLLKNMSSGSSEYHTFLDAIENQLDSWAVGGHIRKMDSKRVAGIIRNTGLQSQTQSQSHPHPRPQPRPSCNEDPDLESDEELEVEEEDEDEVEDFTDMPPLIPIQPVTPTTPVSTGQRRHLFFTDTPMLHRAL